MSKFFLLASSEGHLGHLILVAVLEPGLAGEPIRRILELFKLALVERAAGTFADLLERLLGEGCWQLGPAEVG